MKKNVKPFEIALRAIGDVAGISEKPASIAGLASSASPVDLLDPEPNGVPSPPEDAGLLDRLQSNQRNVGHRLVA